jgi:hypothetical protein
MWVAHVVSPTSTVCDMGNRILLLLLSFLCINFSHFYVDTILFSYRRTNASRLHFSNVIIFGESFDQFILSISSMGTCFTRMLIHKYKTDNVWFVSFQPN